MCVISFICGLMDSIRGFSSLFLSLFIFVELVLMYARKIMKVLDNRCTLMVVLLQAFAVLCIFYLGHVFFRKVITALIIFIYNIKHGTNLPLNPNVGFGPWHSIYIGLGWHENPFGISYSDGCAAAKAYSLVPGCAYCDKEYMAALRGEFFRLFKENPAYFMKDYMEKFFVIILQTCGWFNRVLDLVSLFVLNVIIMIVAIKRKHILFFYGLAVIMVVIIFGTLPSMIAVPDFMYAIGAVAAFRFMLFFILLWSIDVLICNLKEKGYVHI